MKKSKKEPHSRQTKRVLVRYLEINLFLLYQKVRNKQWEIEH
nr:MAG TPA: hypothetical protein [Caudoviricetes sp.]